MDMGYGMGNMGGGRKGACYESLFSFVCVGFTSLGNYDFSRLTIGGEHVARG